MSELAKQLFAELGAMAQNGVRQVGAEVSRLGTQGNMELASALFNGHGFVPYGPGQYTPSPNLAQPEQSAEPMRQQDHNRGR